MSAVLATTPPAGSYAAQVMRQADQGTMPITDLFNAAHELSATGQAVQAIALYRLWLEKTESPIDYAVCFNLAVTLSAENDNDAAEAMYRRAIARNALFIEPRLNLGTLLERMGRPDEALAAWREILTVIAPGDLAAQAHYVQALNNLGRLLEIRKMLPEAEAMLARSLELNADQPNVMTHWVHLRQKQCKWPVYSGLEHISVETMMGGTSALAMLSASDDPARQLAAARRFVTEKVNSAVEHLTGEYGYAHSRLRVGYLSSDFNSHAVSILTAELYELHDRSQVEVFGFSWSNDDRSPIRARVVKAMDHYIRIDGIDDEAAARLIRSHEIDILVDLHGLTLGARPNILAYRPAPVQMTYLGFPGPTALPGIDYVIADAFVLPPETAAYFTEQPLYMPETFQINDRKRPIGARPTRASCNLPEDAFVFCSFNNNFKFTPEVFGSWMRILQRVPDSVLWLVADNEGVRESLCRYAEEQGVARTRLIFAARAMPADYLARFQIADLFLDTYPFGAGTTASDALWAGLPLLTRAGPVFASRMAGSLLRAVGLEELITYTIEEYEEKAVAMAGQRPRIAAMKQMLQDTHLSCALFDSPRFVRHLEAAFHRVAKRPSALAAAPAALTATAVAPLGAILPASAYPRLLELVPADARKIVEAGCGDGALAAAYKQRHPGADYSGIESNAAAAASARQHCDRVLEFDLGSAAPWPAELAQADCWILDSLLESLYDPWRLLARIRASVKPGATVVLNIRNFQHWRVQARLSQGDLVYRAGGVLEKPALRVFTRGAVIDMFQQAGFRVSGGMAHIVHEPEADKFLPAIRMMAEAGGSDPAVAVQDALPLSYMVAAVAV